MNIEYYVDEVVYGEQIGAWHDRGESRTRARSTTSRLVGMGGNAYFVALRITHDSSVAKQRKLLRDMLADDAALKRRMTRLKNKLINDYSIFKV